LLRILTDLSERVKRV